MSQPTRASLAKTPLSDVVTYDVVDWALVLDSGGVDPAIGPVAPENPDQLVPTPIAFSVTPAGGPISLTTSGVAYTQNFDTLSNTAGSTTNNLVIPGWAMTETGGGARDNEQYGVDTGASTTGDTYSYGAAASTDRALGGLRSGTLIPIFGAGFQNDTGGTITSLAIAYTGEEWRLGTASRTDQLTFSYSLNATDVTDASGTWITVTGLNFVTPDTVTAGAKNGNAAGSQTALSAIISGLNIAPGATFLIRWTDIDATGGDDGLAIDNFSITPTVTTPSTSVTIGDVSIVEANNGTSDVTFTITRSDNVGDFTVAYATADGTATAGSDYTATSGTATFTAGGALTQTFTVTITGDTVFEPNETFLVNLSNLASSTGTATISDAQGIGTITNDEAVPAFSINDVTLAEGNAGTTAFTFTVTLSGPSQASSTVAYAIGFNGSTDATDFAGALPSGMLTFAAGETTKTVTVNVQGDVTFEPDETFVVNLSNPTGGTAIADSQGLGTITNDDAAPANGSLDIADLALAEGSSGGVTNFVFTVTRSGGSAGAVSAAWTVSNGTTDAADFGGTLPSGTVSFADGETSKTISVPVAADMLYENNELFTVTLSAPTGGVTIGDATAAGTIIDDDAQPTLSISDPVVTEGDSGDVILSYVVTASAVSGLPITFNIATANGTATAGSDYDSQSVTGATIAAGQTTYTFNVVVHGDLTAEPSETVLVNLTSPTNATIADAQGVGTITNDDGAPTTALIFSESFTGFTAAGFNPTPGAGQLDSDVWRVVGLSDIANPAYGFTGPAGGDFGRGLINANDPATAGVYSPASNNALILQPTGAELDVNGFIEAKIQNNSGSTASSFDVAFDWAYRNSADRGENMQLSYSTDGVNFTVASAANFQTPLTLQAGATFTTQHEDVTLTNLFVGNGGYLYLRWTHVSSVGGGSRDEVGIDNVSVTAGLSAINVASVNSFSIAEGNSGQTDAVFTITRSGGNGTASVNYATSNGTAVAGSDYDATSGTVTFAEGETSKTVTVHINGDTANEANETLFLTLSNPTNLVLSDPRGTATIVNDDTGPIGIYDIQGLGIVSSFAGQVVTTTGVVTAVDTNGFYLQDPTGDGNIGTSDAIFVFTSTAPTVVVGNAITITGTVAEFVSTTAGSASLTELTNPTSIIVNTQSVALPAAVLIATDGSGRAPPTGTIDDDGLTSYDPTTDSFDFYESLEGMLVTIQTPRVVSNTNSFGETYVVASNGAGSNTLNDRGGNTIAAGDNNPETIVITRDAGVYSGYTPTHTQNDTLADVTGILTYQFAQYELIVTAPVTITNDVTLVREKTALVGDATHLSYATFNVENLAPVADSTVPDRDSQAKVDLAFARHASEIVNALNAPDLIGLQEIQDADGIGNGADLTGTATAEKLIAAIVAAGGPTYKYIEVAPTVNNGSGGEPGGNIRNGFLYNPARVTYVEGSAMLLTDAAYNNTRKPLIADFVFNGQQFTAADLHSTSRGGSDPLYGDTQPPVQAGDSARTAQATALANYLNGVLAGDPNHKFLVNGDFNGYYYEDALKALQSTNGGTGPLNNLFDLLPVQERYTYYFGGYYQAFDNILVSGNLYAGAQVDIVHYNAGFTDGLSATDHDQTVSLLQFVRAGGVVTAVNDRVSTSEALALRGTVLSNDTGGDATTVVTAVNGAATVGTAVRLASGALVTVNADGTYVYNPDGAFSALATGETAIDTFRYTLSGGATATVTVTITGVTNGTPSVGNETLSGDGGGNNFDLSQGGDDVVSTGAGNDSVYFGAAFTANDHVDGGSGADVVGLLGNYTGANALVLGATTLTNVEKIALQPGGSYDITTNDATVAAGVIFTAYASGLGAGDSFTFNGSAENNPTAANNGRFLVYGGSGVDTITTGSGNDGIFFGRTQFGASDHVDGGAGADQLGLDGNYTLTISSSQVVNIETLVLNDGSAAPALYDITLADDWASGSDTRTIYFAGLRAGAVVNGAAEASANFIFYGGNGNDTITGGGGADLLNGAGGADILTGGAGADIYAYTSVAYSTGAMHDTIVGFGNGADKIDLNVTVTGIDANASGAASANTLDADLAAALSSLGAYHAVQFTVTGGDLDSRVFEIVDANGIAGYQAGEDYVIELQGLVTPITDVATFI